MLSEDEDIFKISFGAKVDKVTFYETLSAAGGGYVERRDEIANKTNVDSVDIMISKSGVNRFIMDVEVDGYTYSYKITLGNVRDLSINPSKEVMPKDFLAFYPDPETHIIELDIDGDDKWDTIEFAASDNRIVTVFKINGNDYTDRVSNIDTSYSGFYLSDFNEDNVYEITISGLQHTNIFKFENNELVTLNEDININPGSGIYNKKDLIMLSSAVENLLAHTTIVFSYQFINDRFEMITPEEGYFEYDYYNEGDLYTITELIVYTDMDENSESVTIPSDVMIHNNKTDHVRWVNIIYDNNEYWLNMDEYDNIENNIGGLLR